MDCPLCRGTGISVLALNANCELCGGRGEIVDDPTRTQICRQCSGSGISQLKLNAICNQCDGYGRVAPLDGCDKAHGPSVVCIEAGTPRTAHLAIADIFSELTGELCICDPYYGSGSLLRLDLLKHCRPIRFLTRNPEQSEAQTLSRALQEWKQQHGDIEWRRHTGTELHDRFVLASDELVLMGHGLKDVGNKDSFIVRLSRDVADDTIAAVRTSFDVKWIAATVIA